MNMLSFFYVVDIKLLFFQKYNFQVHFSALGLISSDFNIVSDIMTLCDCR